MKKLLLVPLLFVFGCAKHTISVDAVEGLIENVTARHDTYVQADASLPVEIKADYLRSSELLRRVVAEAKK